MKRKRRLRKLPILIILLILTVTLSFVLKNHKPKISGVDRVEIARELKMPDWVEKDIIHKHSTARTGMALDGINNIVIHYVGNPGTTATANRNYFDKETTKVSSHFVVGLSGEVIECLPIYERSAASNHRNHDTISIETCHPDVSGKFTDTTYNSLVRLTAYLCCELDLTENDLIRHYDVTGKICPKYYVENPEEWDNFKKNVGKAIDDYRKAKKGD